MGFISRYVREQKRYTKNEIKSIFSFSESEAESFIRRLKSFGIMKAVKNTAGQRDLSDLSDADIEIADDTGESSECFYVFTYVGVLTIGDRVVKCFPKYITQRRLVILNAKEQIPRRMTGTRSIAFIFLP